MQLIIIFFFIVSGKYLKRERVSVLKCPQFFLKERQTNHQTQSCKTLVVLSRNYGGLMVTTV